MVKCNGARGFQRACSVQALLRFQDLQKEIFTLRSLPRPKFLACVAIPNSKNYCVYANERLFLSNPVGTMLHVLEADLYKWLFLLFGGRRGLVRITLITANV